MLESLLREPLVHFLLLGAALPPRQITTLHAVWTRIAVRVAGSSITAASPPMLGWLVRPLL